MLFYDCIYIDDFVWAERGVMWSKFDNITPAFAGYMNL